MNQVAANLLKGIFQGINPTTAYRLGLWINGLFAAAIGALIASLFQLGGQVAFTHGPIKWAMVWEWAKAGAAPAVFAYFKTSPFQAIFSDQTMTVATSTQTTPTSKTESSITVIESTDKQP